MQLATFCGTGRGMNAGLQLYAYELAHKQIELRPFLGNAGSTKIFRSQTQQG